VPPRHPSVVHHSWRSAKLPEQATLFAKSRWRGWPKFHESLGGGCSNDLPLEGRQFLGQRHTRQRKRIAAIRRDPRVSVVVSSHGTDLGPAKGITAKGRAIIHDDPEIQQWFYRACAAVNIPTPGKLQDLFAQMMDTEKRHLRCDKDDDRVDQRLARIRRTRLAVTPDRVKDGRDRT